MRVLTGNRGLSRQFESTFYDSCQYRLLCSCVITTFELCGLARVHAAGPDPGEADPTAARGVRARCDCYNVGGYNVGGYDGDADRQPYSATGRCSYRGTDRSMARHRARMRACGRPTGAGNFNNARTNLVSQYSCTAYSGLALTNHISRRRPEAIR